MAIVCQKCGVGGWKDLLVYCCLCHAAAEHQYCFDTISKLDENIEWACEKCKNGANSHAHEDHEIKAWKMTQKRSKRSSNSLIDGKPNGRRKLILPDEDDDMIDDVAKVTSVERETIILGTNVTIGRSFERNKHNHQERKLTLLCEENEGGAICSKPNGRRRKLILPDEDYDMIDDLAKDSSLKREINTLEKNVTLGRSFEKHNDHEKKLTLPGEKNEDNNFEAKETMVSSILQKTYDEMTSKTKNDNCLMRWDTLSVSARPISWRGWFKICGRCYGPLIGHLSPKACEKAWNATRSLSQIIPLSIVSRSQAWPRNFKSSPPTDDHIALFFFPPDSRVEEMVDQLIEEVIRSDLMLKVALDEAELLIFPSNLLPVDYNRYQDKYYLWGVFKRKNSNTNTGDITMPQTNENSLKKTAHNALIRYGVQIEKVNKEMVLEGDEPPGSLIHLTDEDGIKETGNDRGEDEEFTECLELFPTQVENIGLRLKVGDGKKGVDVDLCLGMPFRQ
ncbi:PHD finger-containing protein 1-like [Carex rostrata]